MADILTEASDLDDVRAVLGVDSTNLPDSILESALFLVYIENIVEAMVDTWSGCADFDTLKLAGGTNWDFIRAGTMMLLAAHAVGYINMKEADSVRIGNFAQSGRKIEWPEKRESLIARASEAFGNVTCRTFTAPSPVVLYGPSSAGRDIPDSMEEYVEKIQPRFLDFIEEGEDEDDTYYSS